jgi:hypothetical protein
MRMHRVSLAVLCALVLVFEVLAQSVPPKESAKMADIGVPEPGSQLLEENEYFRVVRANVVAGATTAIEHHGRDAVVLSLGEGLRLSVGTAPEPGPLKEGEARFLPLARGAKVANLEDRTLQMIVVELKQHWEPDVHVCSEPSKCSRPIVIGDFPVGETTSLFTNGFVTAYSHRLDRGGTLSSAYFSTKGKDHLLLIALTELHANFDGTDEVLRAGQTYASDATQIEVNAADTKARWIVIRVQIPRHEMTDGNRTR